MLYIFALILIFFALPVIGRLLMRLVSWYVRRKLTQQTRRAFEQAFGGQGSPFSPGFDGGRARQEEPRRPDEGRHRGPRRGKRIDPSVGEYVEYDEITVSQAEQTAQSTGRDDSFVAESQVVDAEWEEIR